MIQDSASCLTTRIQEGVNERHIDTDENMEESLEVILLHDERTEKSVTEFHPKCLESTFFGSSPEILRQVIQSGYLDYREMGRLLLFVSKSITELGYLCDDIWRSLLVNRFGVERSYEMMNKLHCGPQKCFRHLTKTEPLKSQKIVFTPSDYRIIINVYDDVGKRIIFKIVCGEEIGSFFNDGYAMIESVNSLKHPLYARYSGLFQMKATVHIVRIPDQKSICIIDERKGLNEYSLEKRYFVFTTSTSPLALLSLSTNGIPHGIYFNLRIKIRKTNSRDICDNDCSVAIYGNVMLEAVWYPTSELYKDERHTNKGSEFLDILNNLYGWS